ncbi:hypothetical protein CspeluHIS016_0113160 [Cutaneotrichosporon spelunceum]|uniref:Ima1 N-terminal domain-containing protein n=1 Tax=Cutaneotrichosporon spelunceum TaxID=1672016 RepID=A0AAD3TQW5_9TREE|nr:hypothetical protein CspeluHIS016_0113160 [Cutaneotrichosporon spelunceum]
MVVSRIAMNEANFARRAHPSSSRLPTAPSASSPFCHNCQANQTLVVNLLATYLPDESDPAYAERLASLDAYRVSLYQRYPPVCPMCQPGVDMGLKRADQRAQAEAFGSALKRGVDTPRQASLSRADVGVWRARSVAWTLDVFAAMGVGLCAWTAPETLYRTAQDNALAVLAVRAAAILWAVWDPTWLRAAREGRPYQGRRVWVGVMFALYLLRIAVVVGLIFGFPASWIAAAAAVDITMVIAALTRRRDTSRIELKLVRPVRVEARPQPCEPPHHASHSSPTKTGPSSKPQSAPSPTRRSAVFGQPSLALPEQPDEPMDWEPTHSDWDGFGVGTQRMFAPAESNETGLEALLATWGLGGEPVSERPQSAWERSRWAEQRKIVSPESRGVFAIPQPVVQRDVLRPLRVARAILLALRVVALVAVLTQLKANGALQALLGLEAAVSTVTLGATLPSRSWSLAVLAAEAAVRVVALLAPGLLPLPEALRAQAPALECVAWAVADAVALLLA